MHRYVNKGRGVTAHRFDADVRSSCGSPMWGVFSSLLWVVQGEFDRSLLVVGPEGSFPGHVSNVEPEGAVSLVYGYPRAILGMPSTATQGFPAHLTVGMFNVGAGEAKGNL